LRDAPHEFLRGVAAQYGPVVRFPIGPFRFHVVSAPEDVQRVLVTNQANYGKDTFQYRLLARITGEGLLTMDGPRWLKRRRLAQPSFHRARVEEFAPIFARVAEALGDRWERAAAKGQSLDVAADMMLVALQAVVEALFSEKIGDEADALAKATLEVLHHIMAEARMMGMVPHWLPTPGNRRFRQALSVLDKAIHETLAERRSRESAARHGQEAAARGAGEGETPGPDDLLGRLMAGRVDGEALTDQELRDEMLTLLIAGHETVASALTWAWYLLGTHPNEAVRLEAEVDDISPDAITDPDVLRGLRMTGAVFQEALRLYPPAWIVTRVAREADVLGGYEIPAGGLVVTSPYVTQRDAALWPDPPAFKPDRFLDRPADRPKFAYFPFGGGPHLCIGNHFAAVEAAIILASLARRFRLRPLSDQPPVVDPGVTLQPKGGLLMGVERR
jgi:cytochrome P450